MIEKFDANGRRYVCFAADSGRAFARVRQRAHLGRLHAEPGQGGDPAVGYNPSRNAA